MKKLSILLLLCLGLYACSSTSKQADGTKIAKKNTAKIDTVAAKKQDIRTLLDMVGSAKMALESIDQMMGTFKTTMPQVPTEFWDNFRGKVKGEDLVDLIVPIYNKHFTYDEIQGLIQFYKTPIGQKFIETLPAISQESSEAGRQWGEKIGLEVIKELEEKGY